MSAPYSWRDLRDALQAAVVTGSGLAATKVIWQYQDMGQPALPYAALTVSGVGSPGQDDLQSVFLGGPMWAPSTAYAVNALVENGGLGGNLYRCTTAGTSAASGGPSGTGSAITDGSAVWAFVQAMDATSDTRLETLGFREGTLGIEVFSATVADENDALSIAEQLRAGLRRPSVRAALAVVGVSIIDTGPVQFVPAVVAVGFRGRATLDVRCAFPVVQAPSAMDLTGIITSVTGTLTAAGDGGGTVTAPFAAP